MCGMVLCALVVIYGILGFVFQCTKNVKHAKIANCFLILGYVSTLVWQVYGTFLRYNAQGRVCCGDDVPDGYWNDPEKLRKWDDPNTYTPYLFKSGSYMTSLIIVLYCFYGCMCCCGSCACVAFLCGYRRELS